MKIRNVEELEVWQRAHELALLVYRLTKKLPREEQFGLVAQMRRAASAVPANIAEGFGRRTTGEMIRSLRVANGETEEVRYFARLARDLTHFSQEDLDQVNALCGSVSQLISALVRSLSGAKSRITSHESRVTRPTAVARS